MRFALVSARWLYAWQSKRRDRPPCGRSRWNKREHVSCHARTLSDSPVCSMCFGYARVRLLSARVPFDELCVGDLALKATGLGVASSSCS